jgi:hypothetical protein
MDVKSDTGIDLLWGARAIGNELGITTRRAFHLLEEGEIPAGKVGGRWVAVRDQLHDFFRHPPVGLFTTSAGSRPHTHLGGDQAE